MVPTLAAQDIQELRLVNATITGDRRIEIFGDLTNQALNPSAVEWLKNCCRPLFRTDDWPLCLTALNGKDVGFSVMYNHGINLNKKQVGKHLNAFSSALGESTILGVCRKTRGILPDAWSICSLRRKGGESEEVRLGAKLLTALIEFEKQRGGKVLIIAYSGGADVTRYQLQRQNQEDVKKHVDVITIAPSCIIRPSECANVINLISEGDYVTRVFETDGATIKDSTGYFFAKANPAAMGVKFLQSNTPFYKNDHNILGDTYLPALLRVLENYHRNYNGRI